MMHDVLAPVRIAIRLLGLVGLLLACVPAHYIALAVTRRSVWPRRFLGAAARIVGADVRVVGTPAPAPLLLLANHVSWIDVPALAGASGSAFVAHAGLGEQPLLRWLCRLNRTVFITRDRRGSVAEQTAQVRDALAQGDVLTLFLEGTTGDGVTLAPFKSSLLAAIEPVPPGLAVQPVLIDYGAAARRIAWTDDEPGLRNFMRILGRAGRLPVKLHFLPPLTEAEMPGRKAMTAAARGRIEQAIRTATG